MVDSLHGETSGSNRMNHNKANRGGRKENLPQTVQRVRATILAWTPRHSDEGRLSLSSSRPTSADKAGQAVY